MNGLKCVIETSLLFFLVPPNDLWQNMFMALHNRSTRSIRCAFVQTQWRGHDSSTYIVKLLHFYHFLSFFHSFSSVYVSSSLPFVVPNAISKNVERSITNSFKMLKVSFCNVLHKARMKCIFVDKFQRKSLQIKQEWFYFTLWNIFQR